MDKEASDRASQWEEVRPSRASVAVIHSRRLVNTWGNSKPYLSGDLFADESDVSVFGPKFRRIPPTVNSLKRAEVVFCPSSRLEEMFESFSGILKPKVVICGNDDHDFYSLPTNIPSSVRHFFLQNSMIPNSSLTTSIPIGLENLRWGKNGFPNLMQNSVPWKSRQDKLMIGPFGLTHPDRYTIRDAVPESSSIVELFEGRLSPKELSKISQQFKFIAAVRGNGIDTHRHWETAYRGSYAVVKDDLWLSNFKGTGLPFIGVNSFDENEISDVLKSHKSAPRDPKDIPLLWWPYWKNLIKAKLG